MIALDGFRQLLLTRLIADLTECLERSDEFAFHSLPYIAWNFLFISSKQRFVSSTRCCPKWESSEGVAEFVRYLEMFMQNGGRAVF